MRTNAIDLTREGMAARDERVAVLTRAGHSAHDISAIIGVSVRTVERIRQRLGMRLGGQCKSRTSAETLAAAKEMLEDGASRREVARTIGVSQSNLAKWLPGHKWTLRQCGQHARMMQEFYRLRAETALAVSK